MPGLEFVHSEGTGAVGPQPVSAFVALTPSYAFHEGIPRPRKFGLGQMDAQLKPASDRTY
jgi:hypothetical protein